MKRVYNLYKNLNILEKERKSKSEKMCVLLVNFVEFYTWSCVYIIILQTYLNYTSPIPIISSLRARKKMRRIYVYFQGRKDGMVEN